LGLSGSAVFTIIEYKRTNRQTSIGYIQLNSLFKESPAKILPTPFLKKSFPSNKINFPGQNVSPEKKNTVK